MSRTLLGTLLVLVTMVSTGCNQKSLEEENSLLTEENQTLRAQLEDRNAALESSRQELQDRDLEVSSLRRQMGGMSHTAAAGATGFEGIAGVTGSFGAGEVTATVESDILFDAGRATLKTAAKQALDAVAQVLNPSYGGKEVRVSGHTDTDPIRKSGHKSNYHLGFERSFAVRDYLVSRGVARTRIYLASHGPDQPRGSKSASRRVEIIVALN